MRRALTQYRLRRVAVEIAAAAALRGGAQARQRPHAREKLRGGTLRRSSASHGSTTVVLAANAPRHASLAAPRL